jgi:hypothetical protein
MLSLPNHDADRLAQVLDQAEHLLRELAGEHAKRADAMDYLHDRRLRDYHREHRTRILVTAQQVADAARHARARTPWTVPKQRRPTRAA